MLTASYAEADARLVAVAKHLHVLQLIAWPAELCDRFLEGWRRGQARLPEPPPVAVDLAQPRATLEELARPVADDPGALFVARTARSYSTVVRMLEAAGTPEFTRGSIELYGRPSDTVTPEGLTSLSAAEQFLEASASFQASCPETKADYCLTPEHVSQEIAERVSELFGERKVEVQLDPTLLSKAAAGAERIRIRSETCFSAADLEQLWQHEACVHTATALNGRLQPQLTCLSLGAPRTTATQEGLATFAELITGAIDIARLRRLALRVKAIAMALDGADFIQLFEFFLEAGQGERESFFSTSRIFRGGNPNGSAVFTKDGVYLKGLLEVHAFLRAALAENQVGRAQDLFAGRLTCGDVVALAPLFADGRIAPARYQPMWLQRRAQLAAYLAFSALATNSEVRGT